MATERSADADDTSEPSDDSDYRRVPIAHDPDIEIETIEDRPDRVYVVRSTSPLAAEESQGVMDFLSDELDEAGVILLSGQEVAAVSRVPRCPHGIPGAYVELPPDATEADVKPGVAYRGWISGIKPYGAFVNLTRSQATNDDVSGLVPVDGFPPGQNQHSYDRWDEVLVELAEHTDEGPRLRLLGTPDGGVD